MTCIGCQTTGQPEKRTTGHAKGGAGKCLIMFGSAHSFVSNSPVTFNRHGLPCFWSRGILDTGWTEAGARPTGH